MNRQPTGLDQLRYYRENSVIRHGADPKEVDIDLNGKIVVGKFIDIERPTYSDLLDEVVQKAFKPELPKPDTSKKRATVAGSTPK
jgi:2-oxoglutarate ferredoxin oxidoreductase subunit beta